MSVEEKKPVFGKIWTNVKTFSSFEEADALRNALIKEWAESNKEGMQAKVKLVSKGFIVKKRLHPDFEPKKNTKKTKKGKKNGKNSRTNTKNTENGKDQPS
jgi:hypothetical protein